MKIIIAGSRELTDYNNIVQAVQQSPYPEISEVVCGGARGPDKLGQEFAEIMGIPVKLFPADWNKYGNSAGIIRNCEMAVYADALIAVWDGKSKGTLHMINDMVAKKKPVFVYCPQ